jgi:hypothetical protein
VIITDGFAKQVTIIATRPREIAMGEMGGQGIGINGDGLEVLWIARWLMADLHFSFRCRCGQGSTYQGEQQGQAEEL